MVLIRFSDAQSESRALGYLAGRFAFKSWSNGETLVTESALPYLAVEGIPFSMLGPANFEQIIPAIRVAAASSLQ